MSLISDFFKKLFGNNNQKTTAPLLPNKDYVAEWDREREERAALAEVKLRDWIVAQIKTKEKLMYSWESGNDEVFVTFEDASEQEEDNFFELEQYIIDKLDIPDAGEFEMNGKGNIYIENNFVKTKYSSVLKMLIDFDEENEKEIYGEEEYDEGEKTLFAI
jgi:SepF-like predicted cell division protein (DUF552 family)